MDDEGRGGGWFDSLPPRWSRLGFPSSPDDPRWQESWVWLYQRYEPAMRGYVRELLQRWGGRARDDHDAADVVQSYLAACMEKGWLSRPGEKVRLAAPEDGLPEGRGAAAGGGGPGRPASRGGGDPTAQSLDEDWMEIAAGAAVVDLQRRNKREAEVILDLVANRDGGRCSRGLAARLGLTASQLAVVKNRARRRFAAFLADELRCTVSDDEAFREEWDPLVRYAPWLEDLTGGP